MDLDDKGMCFACGMNNPIGLRLNFRLDGDRCVAEFVPKHEHQGYDNIIHGGIISTLLDEAMAKIVYMKGFPCVTAQLNVRFRKAAHAGDVLSVYGWITGEQRHRIIDCAAEVRDVDQQVIADATARMMRM